MSGLKIKFHKSEVIGIGIDKDRIELCEDIFTCTRGELPLKYLGIPVDEKTLKNSDSDPFVVKIKKDGLLVGKILKYCWEIYFGEFLSLQHASIYDVLLWPPKRSQQEV